MNKKEKKKKNANDTLRHNKVCDQGSGHKRPTVVVILDIAANIQHTADDRYTHTQHTNKLQIYTRFVVRQGRTTNNRMMTRTRKHSRHNEATTTIF